MGKWKAARQLWRHGMKNIHIRPVAVQVTDYEVPIGPFHNPAQANVLAEGLRSEGFPRISRLGRP
jgi:hypothetical protein